MNLNLFCCFGVAFFFVAETSGADLNFLILHNNDMHSRYEETSKLTGLCKEKDRNKKCFGGFGRVIHVVREARRAAEEGSGPRVLYLNAGDTFSGTQWFNVHKWKVAADFLNLLRPDVASFGNHEFDNKIQGLVPFLQAINFPIVAANLNFSQVPEIQSTNVTKSVVLDLNGTKIGVIGYLTLETLFISAPENVQFVDEVAAIKEESERLDGDGVKIIIALGHSGYEVDQRIAKEVPLVDVVIGGHTNTFLCSGTKPNVEDPEGPYPTVVTQDGGKKVPVVQAFAYTKYMGRLNVTFDEDGDLVDYAGYVQLLDASVPQAEDALRLLEKYRPAVAALDKEMVAKSRVLLDGSEVSCRRKECNFANLITDAYVAYHSSVYGGAFWTDAPIAVINGGCVRDSVQPNVLDGSITRGEMLRAMPYDDQILSMSLNGSDLLETLEIGVRNINDVKPGELVHGSGLRYTFDPSKPAGSRIVEAKVRCALCNVPVFQPIVPHRTYRIITTGFLNSGGDGHTVIRDRGANKVTEDMHDIDMVIWYMQKISPIYVGEDERLVRLTKVLN